MAVVAVDGAGNAATTTRTLDVPAVPGTPPLADRRAPRLSAVRVTPTRPRRGAVVRLAATIDEPARVTVRVQRVQAGRRLGRTCVVSRRRGSPCRRVTTLRVRRVNVARAGAFTATLATRTAKPPAGTLRVVVSASDAAGNTSTLTRALRIRR